MEKQKKYSLPLLVLGLIAILFVVSSFTLQGYYEIPHLTMNREMDIIFALIIAVVALLQPKESMGIAAISLSVYGVFNLIATLFVTSNSGIIDYSLYQIDEAVIVFSNLFLLLSHISIIIGTLFIALHMTQPKFELKVTRSLAAGLFGAGLVFLLIPGVLLTKTNTLSVVTFVVYILTMGILLAICTLLIDDHKAPVVALEAPKSDSALLELEKLKAKGLITDAEYETRKEKLAQRNLTE